MSQLESKSNLNHGVQYLSSKREQPVRRRFNLSQGLLIFSVALFAISLTQDCFYIDRTDRDAYANGLGLLLIGWLGVLDGMFAWLANPLLLLAWVLTFSGRNRIVATLSASAALGFSLSFLLQDDMLANEAGGRSAITEYARGYWLWNASIVVGIVAAVMRRRPSATNKDADVITATPV